MSRVLGAIHERHQAQESGYLRMERTSDIYQQAHAVAEKQGIRCSYCGINLVESYGVSGLNTWAAYVDGEKRACRECSNTSTECARDREAAVRAGRR